MAGSPLLNIAIGALTGGVGGGMLGLGSTAGAILGGLSAGNSPISKTLGLANKASSAFGNGKDKEPSPDDQLKDPMASSGSAMDRALSQKQEEPSALIHSSLAALDDPNLPIPYDTRMTAVEQLLRAKHGVLS